MSEDKPIFLKSEKNRIEEIIGAIMLPEKVITSLKTIEDLQNVRLPWSNCRTTYRFFEFKLCVKREDLSFSYSIDILKNGITINTIKYDNVHYARSLCLTENKAIEFVDLILEGTEGLEKD